MQHAQTLLTECPVWTTAPSVPAAATVVQHQVTSFITITSRSNVMWCIDSSLDDDVACHACCRVLFQLDVVTTTNYMWPGSRVPTRHMASCRRTAPPLQNILSMSPLSFSDPLIPVPDVTDTSLRRGTALLPYSAAAATCSLSACMQPTIFRPGSSCPL